MNIRKQNEKEKRRTAAGVCCAVVALHRTGTINPDRNFTVGRTESTLLAVSAYEFISHAADCSARERLKPSKCLLYIGVYSAKASGGGERASRTGDGERL